MFHLTLICLPFFMLKTLKKSPKFSDGQALKHSWVQATEAELDVGSLRWLQMLILSMCINDIMVNNDP